MSDKESRIITASGNRRRILAATLFAFAAAVIVFLAVRPVQFTGEPNGDTAADTLPGLGPLPSMSNERMTSLLVLAAAGGGAGLLVLLGLGYGMLRRIHTLKDRNRELSRELDQAHNAAYFDELTGLPNKSLLLNRLEVARSPGMAPFALIVLEVDRFDVLHAGMGTAAADELLRGAAKRITALVPAGMLAARIGECEFAIFHESPADEDRVAGLTRRLQNSLAGRFFIKDSEVFITASAGIAMGKGGVRNPANILQNARTALAHARKSGRGTHAFFAGYMRARKMSQLLLEHELRRAAMRGEFIVHYQPIVDLVAGEILGFEALARWRHPDGGLVPPAKFIPLVEEMGLMNELSRSVLDQACRQLKIWRKETGSEPWIAVNFSARQFLDGSLPLRIQEALENASVPGSSFKMEITESTAMQDVEYSAGVLRRIRDMDIRISIDDFGTGHSSLAYLSRFPLSTLKIDKSFLHEARPGAETASIIKAILAMARGLNLDVIAEGVESRDQLHFLKSQGCDAGQGYFFSRPIPPEDAGKLLAAGSLDMNNPFKSWNS